MNTSPTPPTAAPLPLAGSKLSITEITNTTASMRPPSRGKANVKVALTALVNRWWRKNHTAANAVSP